MDKIVYIDTGKIEVFDEVFSSNDRIKISDFSLNSSYRPKRQATNSIHLMTKQATLKSAYNREDLENSGILDNGFIKKYLTTENLRVADVYVNLCTASDIYLYHTDTYTKGSKTILYYVNLEWKPHWEGETHFSSNMIDIDYSSAFIPGRLIIFDGIIPHKSSQPSYSAEVYRYIYVIKLVCKEDPEWASAYEV